MPVGKWAYTLWHECGCVETVTLEEHDRRTTLTMLLRYDNQAVRDGVLQSPAATGMEAGFSDLAALSPYSVDDRHVEDQPVPVVQRQRPDVSPVRLVQTRPRRVGHRAQQLLRACASRRYSAEAKSGPRGGNASLRCPSPTNAVHARGSAATRGRGAARRSSTRTDGRKRGRDDDMTRRPYLLRPFRSWSRGWTLVPSRCMTRCGGLPTW